MAKADAKAKKEITMEEALWKSADKLRGSVEPAEYKHVVLSLFFLKFASDKFEAQRKAIAEKYGERFVDNVAFYTKDNVFYLPEESRWSYIIGQTVLMPCSSICWGTNEVTMENPILFPRKQR